MYYSTTYNSPLGEMLIVSDGESVCGVWFYDQKHFPSFDNLIQDDNLAIFKKVKIWFDDYFDGKNPKIDFKLKPDGTKFRLKVWKILSEIPYGETLTYGEIAKKISHEMSAQAVGGAVSARWGLACPSSPLSVRCFRWMDGHYFCNAAAFIFKFSRTGSSCSLNSKD